MEKHAKKKSCLNWTWFSMFKWQGPSDSETNLYYFKQVGQDLEIVEFQFLQE